MVKTSLKDLDSFDVLFVALVGIYRRGGEKSKLLNVITLVYDYYMLLLN